MARDRESSAAEQDPKLKKDKKDKKKHKTSEEDGVSKHKSKKSSRERSSPPADRASSATLRAEADSDGNSRGTKSSRKEKEIIIGAMVPFANPLADEKEGRKVLKNVKRSARHKALKRGVKEVVKALRKMPTSEPSNLPAAPRALVVLAADISPYDVISHIPVLCEDKFVPYIFVPSRMELGIAGSTKRPTSVVMVSPQAGRLQGKKGDAESGDDKETWEEIYAEMVKLVEGAGRNAMVVGG